jgi:hypothetical protein
MSQARVSPRSSCMNTSYRHFLPLSHHYYVLQKVCHSPVNQMQYKLTREENEVQNR